jgi:hypothetical protein
VLGGLAVGGLMWSARKGSDAASSTTSGLIDGSKSTVAESGLNASADTTIAEDSILVNPVALDTAADDVISDTSVPSGTSIPSGKSVPSGTSIGTRTGTTVVAPRTATTRTSTTTSGKRTTTTKSKGRATTTTTLPPLGEVVTVADEGLSLRVPVGWKAVSVEGHPTPVGGVLAPGTHPDVEDPTALAGGVILYAVDVAALDLGSPFVSSMNVIKLTDIGGATLTTLQNQARQGLIDIGSKVTASEIITLSDKKVIRIRYNSATNVPGVQYWFTTATKAWILTFNYRSATLDLRRIDASAASLNI